MAKKKLAENIGKAIAAPYQADFSNKRTTQGIAYTGPTADDEYLKRRAKAMGSLQNISKILGLGVSVGDAISQRNQEKEALGLVDRIQTPTFAPRSRNQALAREMRNVDIDRMNPYGAVAPVQDQINIGYQQDLARAQALSGGQASTAGALGQAAALRRDAGLAGLSQAALAGMSQQDARALQIANAQAEEDANRDYLNMYRYQIDSSRAMQEGQAVGDAISSSRLRRLQARNDAWVSLLTSPVFDINTYEKMLTGSLTSTEE